MLYKSKKYKLNIKSLLFSIIFSILLLIITSFSCSIFNNINLKDIVLNNNYYKVNNNLLIETCE